MGKRRTLLALAVLASLVGCGEHPASDPVGAPASEEGGAEGSYEPVLFDAGAAAFGDAVLVAGGHYQASATDGSKPLDIRASNVVAEYSADGTLMRTEALPVPEGTYLVLPTILDLGGTRYVAGGLCPLPRLEAGFCGAASPPAVYRLVGGDAEALDVTALELPPDPAGQLPPGAGRLVAIGASSEAFYMVQPTEAGPLPMTSRVRLVRYSEKTGFELIALLPSGVLTAGSVCASQSGVIAVVPTLDSQLRITALEVEGLAEGSDHTWRGLGSVKIDPPIASTYGGITCSDSAGSFWLEDAGATVVWSFEINAPGPSVQISESMRITGSGWARTDNGRIILTATAPAGEGSIWDFSEPSAGGRRLGDEEANSEQIGRPRLGVALKGGVFDIADLLLTVPDSTTDQSKAPQRVSD